jgi:enoyl-CoA hydratase/carnithine racemase
LSRLPLATISEIRGRTRGAGSEFVLATDIRFASEKAVLGQFEVGVGAVPGGGPMARLGRLVGRGRALEILLGGDDVPASLAAEYGYVNRVVPDGEIEGFIDAFARRIAAFDKVSVAGIKKLVDVATLPEDDEFAAGLHSYFATAGRPENRPFVQLLFKNGLQQPDGIETNLGSCERTHSSQKLMEVPSARPAMTFHRRASGLIRRASREATISNGRKHRT